MGTRAIKARMLDGYKVLDFTQALAGPTATRYLGQMGAQVIKVEIAPNGDISRAVPFCVTGAPPITSNRIAQKPLSRSKEAGRTCDPEGTYPKGRCSDPELRSRCD